ncbi:MAG: efflux RND transporter periplasmic adaptor subunit [Flavitalea sp.]
MKKIEFIVTCLFFLAACKQEEVVKPEIKHLTEAVYASGTLVPENEYKVVASTDGYLETSLVKEGDSVKKGQLLFKLTNDNQQAQVHAASQLVQKTLPVTGNQSPGVMEIESRLAAVRIHLENDRQQYERYKNLFDQDAISSSTYEKYLLQYQTTSKELESLQQQLHHQRLSSALQLQLASNQLQVATVSRANGQVKSFSDGVVFEVLRQTGDMVYPNQPIALVGSGKMIAKLLVDEDDFQKVKQGQKILITMDAYPGKTFSATLYKIYPLLNKVEQSFRVDALFDEELPVKVYGLNIEANIVIKEKVPALVIPKAAVLKGDSVLIREGDKTRAIKITRGVEDRDWVQVTTGLHSISQQIVLQ